MTRKEARELLKGKKVYVGRYGVMIQLKLFEIGFTWPDEKPKEVKNTHKPFLFFNEHLAITCSNNVNNFMLLEQYMEITAEEILAIEIEEQPHQFKPFDRVLFRIDCENDFWRAGLYSHRCNSSHYILGYGFVQFSNVIPYEGNEDKLGKE